MYDSLRIEQVIRNLLDNALKYGGSGHIDIMLSHRGESLLFGIGDQGVGVPQSEREAIFDIFTQSSRTRTGAGGTGIGLSIAKSILEDHGGKIWVECKKESGSIFWFTLPRVTEKSNTQQNTAALEPVVSSAPVSENKKPLLLVIDDDLSILNMSSLLLASLGFEVITADCGEAGFKVLQQRAKEIDVVLLDVMMPDIYGINLLQKIKADERIKSIPIYMHSGMSDQSEIERAMTLGATGFIEKTVGLAKIKEILKDFLYVDAE